MKRFLLTLAAAFLLAAGLWEAAASAGPRPAAPVAAAPKAAAPATVIAPKTSAPLISGKAAAVDSGLSPERRALLAKAASYVGTQEKTGNNDGPEIERWLRNAGASKGDPYCAAFVFSMGLEALGKKNPFPKSAWSPDMVAGGTRKIDAARPGDSFGIYFSSKGRVAHTGLVAGRRGTLIETLEANTSPSAESGSANDRNGDGVWRKYRPASTLYMIRSWLP